MTKRVRDWQSRLQACLAERRALPFAWGSQDCVLFAADCVRACTGEDPAVEIRGSYGDALSAARVLRERGGLTEIADAHLGGEIAPALAQPGDVGIVLNDGRECLAVCTGAMWHAPGATGLVALPAIQVQRVWRLLKAGG